MSVALAWQATPRLWVHLIGPMQVMDQHGQSLLPNTRRARAVLAILALASPRPVSRERFTALLWSRRERAHARGSLRQCVHEIQALLQPLGRGIIEADREQLRLHQEALWLDVRAPGTSRSGVLLENLGGLDPAFDAWLDAERMRFAGATEPQEGPRGARLGLLPLRVIGPKGDDAISEAIVDEITASLSRFRWIACIAQADVSGEPQSYLLDGTLRHAGPQVRVTLRVRDMRAGGEVVWTRNFSGQEGELLALQDTIAAETAAQINVELLAREGGRATTRLTGAPTAYDLTLAAVPGIFRLERDSFDRAGKMLSEAIRLGPDESAAHTWYAHWHVRAVGQGWASDARAAMRRAGELADRAVTLDQSDAHALTIAGHVRGFLYKHVDEALALHERALALNPALPLAWAMSGLAQTYRGEHKDAIRRVETALRLSPVDPHAFFFEFGRILPHLMLGDYERAAALARLAAQLKPGYSSSWKALLTALGHLGRRDEAAEVLRRLLALEPGFSVTEAIRRTPFSRAEDLERVAVGLRLGGLPE